MATTRNVRSWRTVLLLTIVAALCFVSATNTADAAEQIDQNNLRGWHGGCTNVNPTAEGRAAMRQTFTPACSNVIAVEIDILTINPGRGDDMTVQIAKDGDILISAERTIEDGFSGLLRFDFPEAVPLVPEQVYELTVRDTGKSLFGWKYGSNTYERGSRYILEKEHPGTDWLFRTYSDVELEPAKAKYSGGTGTPDDPYQIATAEDLMLLGESPEDYDKHFILTADIDLDPNLPGRKVFDRAVIAPDVNNETGEFDGAYFIGVFDGNEHIISNLTIQGGRYLGLFGYLGSGAEVRDLGVVDVNITDTYIGINNQFRYAGGLVGCNRGSIGASYSSGSVKGNWHVGGLVGSNGGTITMSYSIASVSGYSRVGGLVGGCGGSICASYSKGSVSGTYSIGGLVGGNWGNIITSYASGSVSGYYGIGSRFGGLIGENSGSIIASYSSASVSGDSDVGGLVGDNTSGSISSSYSIGSVSGTEQVGGLVGKGVEWDIFGNEIRGNTSMSFWDIQTSGQASSDGGTGLTTSEMQDIETFLSAGWDFVDEVANGTCDFWQMSPGDYPQLSYIESSGPLMPEGLGTAEQPYLIRDVRDLSSVWFKPMAHYCLAQSVDLSGITWSTAVIPWFGGSFDGNGYVIGNLHIRGDSYLGLFGKLASQASVCNLGMEAVEVNGSGDCIGGLVGSFWDGTVITHCYSTGSVRGADNVGGLIGHNGGSVTMSYSNASVNGISAVGGLVGRNAVNIATSFSNGSVSGSSAVGGLVGLNLLDADISMSYSGGLVSGNSSVGGLVGVDNRGWITRSYSSARVSGNTNVGGLVGSNFHTGGYIALDAASRSCFWDIQASGQTGSAHGIGKTTAEMQTADTFLAGIDMRGNVFRGWDFIGETANGTQDIWWILEGRDYPRLWWELIPVN